MKRLNKFGICHHHSLINDGQAVVSNLTTLEIWNLVTWLQYKATEIDPTHVMSPSEATTLLVKFYDVFLTDYDTNDALSYEIIDLHWCWENGFFSSINSTLELNGERLDGERVEHMELFNNKFHRHGIYAAIFELILQSHELGEGEADDDTHINKDSPTWGRLKTEFETAIIDLQMSYDEDPATLFAFEKKYLSDMDLLPTTVQMNFCQWKSNNLD
jgi:hypothetical protein